MAIAQPGAIPTKYGQGVTEDEGEESDEYEVPDEEDEEEGGEGEEGEEGESDDESGDKEEEGGQGLTAMLLGDNTSEVGIYDDQEDKGWVPGGGKEPADYSGEEYENEDDQDEPTAPPTSNGSTLSSGKKRALENDPTEGDIPEQKKAKLSNEPTY